MAHFTFIFLLKCSLKPRKKSNNMMFFDFFQSRFKFQIWPYNVFFWKTKKFENRSLFDNFLTAYNVGWKFNHVAFEKGQVQGFRRTINHIDTTPTAFWINIQTLAVFTKNTFSVIFRNSKKIIRKQPLLLEKYFWKTLLFVKL